MRTLVFDTSPLSCFARSGQMDLLEMMTEDDDCVTTRAVMNEIEEGVHLYSELESLLDPHWLRVERVDGLSELALFPLCQRE